MTISKVDKINAILKHLEETNGSNPKEDYSHCGKAAREGNLDKLKSLHEDGFVLGDATDEAAENGHLECLKYAIEHGCDFDGATLRVAVENGHLDCAQYLLDTRAEIYGKYCRDDYDICDEAAREGNLDKLKSLHEDGFVWGEGVCEAAAENGHLDCLKYAIEEGCPCDDVSHRLAVENGHLECAQYLREQGY